MVQYLNGDYRFSMESVVELSALLLQAYRGTYSSGRDTVQSVVSALPSLCPAYALTKGSIAAKPNPKGIVLNSMKEALTPRQMAEGILKQYQGA